jgi:hypothetical protein
MGPFFVSQMKNFLSGVRPSNWLRPRGDRGYDVKVELDDRSLMRPMGTP